MPVPYLIQRFTRIRTEGSLKECRFGQVWGCDYMGSAEYEFGAVPKFLRQMAGAKLAKFTETVNSRKVFGVYVEGAIAPNEIKPYLQSIADGTVRLKEGAMFLNERWNNQNTQNTEFAPKAWGDIVNGIFWSIENMNDALVSMFENSRKYMDAQK